LSVASIVAARQDSAVQVRFDDGSVAGLLAAAQTTLVAAAIILGLIAAGLVAWKLHDGRQRSHLDRPRRDRRRRPAAADRDPREALELVGDALAAAHNPRVLLPVILEVITEATGARGGQVFAGEEEVGWVGIVGDAKAEIVSVPLGSSAEGETKLRLHPPAGGFEPETLRLAERLASQAAVALENARRHDVVQRQALTDDLTGLVNRRGFGGALEAAVEQARRFGEPLALILADIDDFKRINDLFGHPVGDEVLRSFSELLRAHVRDVDVPSRIGGEEFAILLPGTDAGEAATVAERMRQSLSTFTVPVSDGRAVHMTSSFGIAELGTSAMPDDLLRAADEALYRAKSDGKNRIAKSADAAPA
jgi:diguanylate cyclase (GGDEF)-like protein